MELDRIRVQMINSAFRSPRLTCVPYL